MIPAIPSALATAQKTSKGPSERWGFGIVLLVAGIGFVGCHLGAIPIVPSPLAYKEQVDQVLKIVPMGTLRDEAIQKLAAAGWRGDFGVSPSIYYCDLWNREDGVRWQMNVALLFDEKGRLYKLRPAQAETEVISAGSRSVQGADRLTGNLGFDGGSASQTSLQPTSATTSADSELQSRSDRPPVVSDRNGRRTPFGEVAR